MKKRIRTINHTYFLFQPEGSKFTTIERMSNLTEVFTETSIEKNIEDITKHDVIGLDYFYPY